MGLQVPHAAASETVRIWERRLNDDAIMAMVKVLGPKKYGVALDLALGGNRYGKKATDEARKATVKAA